VFHKPGSLPIKEFRAKREVMAYKEIDHLRF